MIKIEACVESFEEAKLAQERGAHQIELCSNLSEDGLTPKLGVIHRCLSELDVRVKTMIRPFPGPFVLKDDSAFTLVKKQVDEVKDIGVEEVVFGFVTPKRELDIVLISRLRDYAYPMDITIHKAIDICEDPLLEVRRMLKLGGIKSILTSGGGKTALEGVDVLRSMIRLAHRRIEIISAGKITKDNLDFMHDYIHGPCYHGRKIVGDLS